jgi:hypothetical protein
MLRFLIDSLVWNISDALTSPLHLGVMLALVALLIVVARVGIYILELRARLDESRQRSSHSNVTVMPSQNAPYIVGGILIVISVAVAAMAWFIR